MSASESDPVQPAISRDGTAQRSEAGTVAAASSDQCMACHKAPILYACVPCGHATLCKACGMKLATGGKCKQCGKLFGQLRRTEPPTLSS